MNVLEGPRVERRRVLVDGRAEEGTVEDGVLTLDSGRRLAAATAVHLPAVVPATIVCVHLNYRSRAEEFGVSLDGAHPTYFLKPVTTAKFSLLAAQRFINSPFRTLIRCI